MVLSESAVASLSGRILQAAGAGASIPPITETEPSFDLDAAYAVSAEVIRRRIERGERPVGWKIGFTNRTIWDEYGVHAPIWGPMYDTTLRHVAAQGGPVTVDLAGLVEPRIEPEIVLRIASTPEPGMSAREMLGCIDGVGHGFELVQSLFPGWRFRASDTVAAFALHGLYRCGPLAPLAPADPERWFTMLEQFEIALWRNGAAMDRGVAANVLDGPVYALGHLVRGLAERPLPVGIKAGDLVTTGTVTRAFPVQAGETWRSEIFGLPGVPGLEVRFS